MQLSAIERYKQNLPTRPYCTDNFRYGVQIRPGDTALRCRYVQPNPPSRAAYLVFDVDVEGAALVPEKVGLPYPTVMVVNPVTTHAHMLYELTYPVFPSRSDKADRLFRAVREGYRSLLGADVGYGGSLVQNPMHPQWRVWITNSTYELRELADFVPDNLLRPPRFKAENQPQLSGRNCHLFNIARVFAYGEVHTCATKDELYERTLEYCRRRNVYQPALPETQVRSIARSIS